MKFALYSADMAELVNEILLLMRSFDVSTTFARASDCFLGLDDFGDSTLTIFCSSFESSSAVSD